MRIDKYLWCVRYFKTRTLATTACRKGQVRINQEPVKPSREVFPQDIIDLKKDQINYRLKVNAIPESRIGAKLVDIYRTDTTPKEQFEAQALLKYSKDYYRKKGVGRPTKKDRRDIADFTDDAILTQNDDDSEE
jgi:ribosome-associated heat shock protein Hsp15